MKTKIISLVTIFGALIVLGLSGFAQTPISSPITNPVPVPVPNEELDACICAAFEDWNTANSNAADCDAKADAARDLANAVRACINEHGGGNMTAKVIDCPSGKIKVRMTNGGRTLSGSQDVVLDLGTSGNGTSDGSEAKAKNTSSTGTAISQGGNGGSGASSAGDGGDGTSTSSAGGDAFAFGGAGGSPNPATNDGGNAGGSSATTGTKSTNADGEDGAAGKHGNGASSQGCAGKTSSTSGGTSNN